MDASSSLLFEDISEAQKHVMAIVPRICACISIMCVVYMQISILRSPYRRQRIYHRIMLGCTVAIVILNAAQLWGPTAAPTHYDHVLGARGNYTTCSIQGFLYQFRMVVPSYYFVLAILTRRLVTKTRSGSNSTNVSKTNSTTTMPWLKEAAIHIGVFIFPIASGIYLWTVEGLNMITLGCGVASEPLGCGDQSLDDSIECTRGPQNIGQLTWLFVGLPAALLMICPTLIMISIYMQLRFCLGRKTTHTNENNKSESNPNKKQQQQQQQNSKKLSKRSSSYRRRQARRNTIRQAIATSVAMQSALYLLALYWTYIFRWIDAAMIINRGQFNFATNLLAEIIDPLQGLWTLIVYWYFSQDASTRGFSSKTMMANADSSYLYNNNNDEKDQSSSNNNDSSSSRSNPNSGGSSYNSFTKFFASSKPEFSIFDGTNVANSDSPWAAFLQDEGEDDEYARNCGEHTDTDYRMQRHASVVMRGSSQRQLQQHLLHAEWQEDTPQTLALVMSPDGGEEHGNHEREETVNSSSHHHDDSTSEEEDEDNATIQA